MAAKVMERRLFGYRDLEVWKKGMALAKLIYQLTQSFPPEEKFGVVSQMRRAAVSIPSNIAEGHARRSRREFAQFLANAQGSVAELDTQLQLSVDLGYCRNQGAGETSSLIVELQKMLASLQKKVGEGENRQP